MKGNGKGTRNAPVTFHPAAGSRLTLPDALRDDAPVMPRLPDLPAVDVHEHLQRNAGRYLRALEGIAEDAARTGDLRLQIRVLTFLARIGTRHATAASGAAPCAREEYDFSGVSMDELHRIADQCKHGKKT